MSTQPTLQVHYFNPVWNYGTSLIKKAMCGRFISESHITTTVTEVTCGQCKSKRQFKEDVQQAYDEMQDEEQRRSIKSDT